MIVFPLVLRKLIINLPPPTEAMLDIIRSGPINNLHFDTHYKNVTEKEHFFYYKKKVDTMFESVETWMMKGCNESISHADYIN